MTINVQPGASVSGTNGLQLNTNNTINNLGIVQGTLLLGVNSIGNVSAVNSGLITGVGDGILAGGSATVTNNVGGTIHGSDGISAGTVANVTNAGTISGLLNGVSAASFTGTNSGTITGIGNGIVVTGSANVTNNGGTIQGTGGGQNVFGISAGTDATVINSGTISGSVGIRAQGSADVTNNSGGIIQGNNASGQFGILAAGGNAIVVNSGLITGTGDGVVANGSATVTNNVGGTIHGSNIDGIGAGANVIVINSGVISGILRGITAGAGGSSVFNSGTITGNSGTAVQFAGLNNVLTLGPGSTVNGLVAGGSANIFQLGGVGSATFDASLIGPAQQYRNFSTFNKVNAASWTLTGTNALALPWSVQQGTLNVAGSLANSPFTVQAGNLSVNGIIGTVTVNGGSLGGNGIVGNTTINGGALAPGNSIGLLTVQGNLSFAAASSYMVEVSPSNADRTNVTGAATLGGAVVNASFAPGSYIVKQYTILNATGGVVGTFGSLVSTNLPANFTASLSYTSSEVLLNLTAALGQQNPGALLPGAPLSDNQQNVASSINNFFNSGGAIPSAFAALFGLTGNNLSIGLSQLSGEVATGSQQTTFNAMGLFMGLLTDPFVAGRGDGVSAGSAAPQFADENEGASAYAANGKPRTKSERDAYAAVYRKAPVMAVPFVPSWSVWAAGYGGSQTTDGNAALGSNDTTSRIAGGVAGADYRFSPFTLAGFALAGGGTSFSIANGLGSGRSDLFQAGAFVRHAVGPAYLSAALAYGWQDITTDRTVTIAGVDQLRAKFNANAWSGRLEGGYRFLTPWTGLTPYAAGQFTTFDLPAYTETAVVGANTFALAYGSKSVTASRSELGLRTDNSWAMQDGIFTLRGRFAWAHDFNIDRVVGATFQTLPGASFVVNGAAQAHDAALVTASAEKRWLNGWSAAATFEGEFSNVTRSYAGKGVVRYSW